MSIYGNTVRVPTGSTMACAAVVVSGFLRSSVGAICTQAASLRLTPSALRHLTLARIDFFIPGVSVVGGFSICSSPRLLEQERMIELAVKYTNHPPALWIHNQCTLDSEVAVRVGGEFFFDPEPSDVSRNLVLIAGGVGINPLLSILRHSADLHRERANKGSGYEIGTIKLFYSAKNTSELLFKKNILDLVNEFPEKIACSLHVTKQTTQISAELKPYITEGRITEKEIRDHISKETLFYICGPPPMTDFFSKQLENSHVPKEHICFEKWW
ncbi:oxidoreductase NAD-binding domain-containing protein 1 isoform X3 [Pteropus vampyrus]|uniref:Oxidoreductase NAD-binding domain-containing protein 1 isoform X3 n=2 Tax=Pteropus TaxID=9401 RepID=A0A6P6CGD1_PTEVA|nr:oxidoreductase NAD-binding domain-containing protein 1 isoform X3 [Pteropus vampyrus]